MAEGSETSRELSLVCQSDLVFCDPGDDVVLSCRLDPATSADSMEIMWFNKENLVLHYRNRQITVNVDYQGQASLSVEDLHNGNVSLIIRDVTRSQRGLYICEVINGHQTMQATPFLHISSEDFRLVVSTDTISADHGEDITLPVHLSPETSAVSMEIRWFRGTELIYQHENGQEITNNDFENRVGLSVQQLERGNLSLMLRNVQPSDTGQYTCRIFYDRCVKKGVVHLKVTEMKGDDDAQRVKHLHGVVRQAHDDIRQQREKLNRTLKLLEETLGHEDHGNRERCESEDRTVYGSGPTFSRKVSMEGLPPTFMDDEHRDTTENALSTKTTSSQILQRQTTSQHVILTERATQTQDDTTVQMTGQSQTQERERPSETTQTPERPEHRTQRRHGNTTKKCHIL